MGLLDIGTYAALQQADAIRAAGERGVDDLVGIGVALGGRGIANAGGMPIVAGVPQSPQAPQPAGPAQASVPDVMTPTQAAAYMQVSESDVVAAIDAGELKARKIGSTFRISKSAIDEFLSG